MSTHLSEPGDTSSDMISLATLPYDLLLNIARHLELHDIFSLQLVSAITCILALVASVWD